MNDMGELALEIKVDNPTGAFRSEPFLGSILAAAQCVCQCSLGPLPSPGPIILLVDTLATGQSGRLFAQLTASIHETVNHV